MPVLIRQQFDTLLAEAGLSRLSHTMTIRKTETFNWEFYIIMSADKLQYEDSYWKEILEKDIRRASLEKKLHLVFTLVMFLQIISKPCDVPTKPVVIVVIVVTCSDV